MQDHAGGARGKMIMRANAGRLAQAKDRSDTAPDPHMRPSLRAAAHLLRTIFICSLVLITILVSMPQNETIWTIYDTPLDVVRLLLGVAASTWLVIQLFRGKRDADFYKTWAYLGLVAVPFGLICLGYLWFG